MIDQNPGSVLEVLEVQLGLYSTMWKWNLEGLHALHTHWLEKNWLVQYGVGIITPYMLL